MKIGDKIAEKMQDIVNSHNSSNVSQNSSDNNSSMDLSNNKPDNVTVNVQDTNIVTDVYGDTSNPIPYVRTTSQDIQVEVPNNETSIDSVKKVYEKKAQDNTNKVNSQWN